MDETRVGGVVLAAGRSLRMGRPKALLEVEGTTFVERAIAVLRAGGCDPVVVVVPAELRSELSEAAGRAGGEVVVNDDADSEQIDSLRLALSRLAETDAAAAAVLPVDHPLVTGATVGAVVAAWRAGAGADAIVRAVHDGRPGHPTLFPRPSWPALHTAGLPRGARSVIDDADRPTVDVEVDDAGVVADVDTPAGYRLWIGGGDGVRE